ncbi:MAG: aspartyl-tRNA synthetase [Pseudomonadota bacterium]|nr:aspartyl-tRNA synthetase [Pseudomonadota bacterium]
MKKLILNRNEMEALFKQAPQTKGDGGWQSLLVKLQRKCNAVTGEIELDLTLLERIRRYAFDYKEGGWENYLKQIFSRTLGNDLEGR